MIVIAGTLPVQPDKRTDAEAACTKMSLASKAENGCGAYEFAWDIQDPNVLRIFEQWDTQQAIDAHFAAPHMAEFGAALGGLLGGAPSITRYEVSSSGPLMGG
jgi:quinol monooxygenase YgiN